ncbi:mechanosensitive ion channel family protein [Ramlibacter sp.]|uniref:mechanosensitive ion channel family protein n=1 Tax=Ramlibacter sp. TaxID=1917967 RepID=UPI002FC64CC0
MNALDLLLRDASRGALAWEVAVLSGCLAVAWGVCWLLGRRAPADSIWFGRGTIDGVLFPMLALGLTYSARVGLGAFREVPLLRIAVPVLIALVGIRLLARVFTVVFPRSAFARVMERLFSWVAWIAAVLWILGLMPNVLEEMEAIRFSFGKSEISLLAIVQGTLSSGLVMVLALWVASALERQVLRDTVADLSLRKAASNAIRATLLLLGFLFALSAVGVDLTALSVLGGALGVGLGFGLQKLAANYVSGFVILAERSLRIGDTVRVDNFEGVVADIKTRYTLIRALNGRESIVPNEKLITERIENLSLADPKVLVSTEVTVGYDSDPDQVRDILLEAARGAGRVIPEPGPGVQLVKFGADGLEFKLVFWIADPQNGAGAVVSEVNLRILKGLRAAAIEIPYPQRVMRMVPPPEPPSSSAA